MRTLMTTAVVAVTLIGSRSTSLAAQESLLPSTAWGLSPAVSAWHFATPIAQGVGAITDVQQLAIPLRAQAQFGGWSLDASGASAMNRVTVKDAGTNRTLTLNGLTDLKIRLSGEAIDGVMVTAGVNLPTGTTGLDADQTGVLQAVGAPALHMPVGALGIGPGATLGVVGAHEISGWALALGGSLERRSEYTPIELALATGKALTKVTPGATMHLTAGADRSLGESRLALLVVADVYNKDQIVVSSGSTETPSDYKLGPQVSALTRIDFGAIGWRESSLNLAVRRRMSYADGAGTTVAGSDGTYVEGSLFGIRGGANGVGVLLGVDARYHTGLPFTDALVGAAVRAGGATLGLEIPSSSTLMRIALRGQYGQFNTGTTSSNGFGATLVWTIAARRGTQP